MAISISGDSFPNAEASYYYRHSPTSEQGDRNTPIMKKPHPGHVPS
jgi:hypothetical protein